MVDVDYWKLQRWVGRNFRGVGAAGVVSLLVIGGCAHQQSGKESEATEAREVDRLESQIEELARTNGRLSKRLDEMEDEVFLLQDRVEAHRLALQRRGRMRSRTEGEGRAEAEAPNPPPQTNYGAPRGRYRVRGYNSRRAKRPRQDGSRRHRVRRIPLSEQQSRSGPTGGTDEDRDGSQRQTERESSSVSAESRTEDEREAGGDEESETLVVTNDDFRKFAREVGGGSTSSGDSSPSASSSSKKAQEPVTDEKLSTTSELKKRSADQKPAGQTSEEDSASAGEAFEGDSGLDLYKSSLAKYRSGEYATALEGFDRFMQGDPRSDYRDNGLYWKGECYFGLGQYDRAIEQFQRVLEEQPDGNKVPDAMLKMALAHRERGERAEAQRLLEKLVQRYPSTNAGRLGKEKLSDLDS